MSKLLIHEPPLQVLPSLAVTIGLNEAIVLQQLHYWLERSTHIYDGVKWVYNSVDEWNKQFPFWNEKTVRRIFAKLEEQKIVITGNYNKVAFDRTKWYSIDYMHLDKLSESSGQSGEMHSDNVSESSGQSEEMHLDKLSEWNRTDCPNGSGQIVRTYTNRLPETTKKSSCPELEIRDEEIIDENEIPPVPKKSSRHKFEIRDMDMANLLFERMLENNPETKKPNLEQWANEVRLMRERDKRTIEQIEYLINWTQSDGFWKTNILSIAKLREKYDALVLRVKQDRDEKKKSDNGIKYKPIDWSDLE